MRLHHDHRLLPLLCLCSQAVTSDTSVGAQAAAAVHRRRLQGRAAFANTATLARQRPPTRASCRAASIVPRIWLQR